MSTAPDDDALTAIGTLRQRLWHGGGYRPIAVASHTDPDPKKAGKAPLEREWQKAAQHTPPDIVHYTEALGITANTGIWCGGLRVFDFDIDDGALASDAEGLTIRHLGAAPTRRRDNSNHFAMVFRAAEGEPGKRRIVGAGHTDELACAVEVLGRGQQLVAYGTHATGGRIYWSGPEPLDMPVGKLPAATEAQITALLEALAALIDAEPPAKPAKPTQRRPRAASGAADGDVDGTAAAPPVALVRLVDELIDYPADDYDTWIKVGCAFYHETNGSDAGLAAWDEWSAKSDRYDADVLAAKWPTLGRGFNGTMVTGATIIYLARQARIARAGIGVSTERDSDAERGGPGPGATEQPAPGQTPPRPPPPPQPPEGGGEGGQDDDSDDGDGDDDDGEGTGGGDTEGDTGTDTEEDGETEDPDSEEDTGEEAEETEDEDGPGPEWIAGPNEIADEDRPPITVVKGLLHRLADEAEQAIIHSRIPVYHRGVLVRPAVTELDAADEGKTHIATLHPLAVSDMMDLMCRTAAWRHWTEKKGYVPDDPPMLVAHILLGRVGQWRLPQVRGILSTPTLRRDGSLLREPGYDSVSRYYLALPPDLHVPAISATPDKSEALAAIRLLEALLTDFPFIDDGGASRAVGLSLLITAVIRAAMIVAPVHAARSPAAGTGKSYWYDVAAAIVYGDRCPVVFAGKSPEELEKKLNGILLRGTSLFNIDNLNVPLEGDLLCQAAERPLLDLRRLGKSDMYLTPNSALVGACGNNLAVHNDLNRRVLMADMDAKMERPELRDFNGSSPFRTVLKDRGKYIAAVLTIVLAYLASRPNNISVPPLASYDDYTRFVREPLWWLGRADPAKTMDALTAADPVKNELTSVMAAWEAAVGLNKRTTVAAIMRNVETPPLPERRDHQHLSTDNWHALLTDVRTRWRELGDALNATTERGGKITGSDLGNWLRRHSNRIAGGRRFVSQTGAGHALRWWLAG